MSTPFLPLNGTTAFLLRDNIDTDQIIPSREMKSVSREGLADGLFAGWRYKAGTDREADPDFVLNKPEQANTTILVAGENFGCGSSREHAVWALKEFGIRAIVAKSFGEIFHGNCIRNGILPITLPDAEIEILAAIPSPAQIEIDLAAQQMTAPALDGWQYEFEIGGFEKRLLMEGLDPIALTLKSQDQIDAFFEQDRTERPWVYSAT